MANARMLHKKISLSNQVNNLSLPAMLLFTWMIPHTDVEGKLKGDSKFVKATVVPMLNWSTNKVEKCIEEIANQGLIYYWQTDNDWIIELVNFKRYQSVREDHEKPSYLPSFNGKKDGPPTAQGLSDGGSKPAQSNINESNRNEVNKSEINPAKQKVVAVSKIVPVNPKTFQPSNDGELAAVEVWRLLEPLNPFAFGTTYLNAYRKGVPAAVIRRFASEIRQSRCDKPGAVFNTKAKDYFEKHGLKTK